MTDLHADELTFSHVPWRAVAVVCGAALLVLAVAFGAGYFTGQRKVAARATQSLDAANIAHGVADAAKQQAQAADAAIEAQAPNLAEARADVVRKASTLAATRTVTTPQPPADPAPISLAELAPMDRAKDELITAQKVYIKELEDQNDLLTTSRDAHKATSDAREREASLLRSALRHDLKWAAGGVYGVTVWGDKSVGAFLDRDFSILRTGVELTKNTYAIQARVGWEIRARLGIRF